MMRWLCALFVTISLLAAGSASGQSWTQISGAPSINYYNPMLLTDGTVLIQDGDGEDWWKLTPDQFGNYVTGTWSQMASTPGYGPLYYASSVLPDGRVFTMGGEYNDGNNDWQNQGFIYDPVANKWTGVTAPSAWSQMGDTGSVYLPNGKLMLCDPFTNQAALFDPESNTFGTPFVNGKFDVNDEEGLTLLPDGTVLTVDTTPNNSEIFDPVTMQWTTAGQTPATLVGLGEEIGPQVLRPDGTVICFGGAGQNCIYNTKTKTWTQAPDFPFVGGTQLDCADAPACLLPSGNVLVMTSPGLFQNGVQFFEWNGSALNSAPNIPQPDQVTSYFGNMLMLPTGQVLLTVQNNLFAGYLGGVFIYNPTGNPNPAWAPTISTVASILSPGQTTVITGTQFNGLSTCSAYGDDEQNFTNYPIIRITNNATGHVSYCREFNPSTMAICTGSQIVSTNFTVPKNIEPGPSTIQVVTNGIASAAVDVDIVPPLQLSVQPTSVIGGNSVTGTLTLKDPAPQGGEVVTLTSNSANAMVPPTVTISAGTKTATFAISTTPVVSDTAVLIVATSSVGNSKATVNVLAPTLSAITVSPSPVVGGNPSTGTVTLTGNAASPGVTVSLSSNNTSATLPANVTIPAGASTATFTVTTTPVSLNTTATITATLGTQSMTATLTITPPSLSGISVSPKSVLGGTPSTGTATLNGPASGVGVTVALTASPNDVTMPATVTIAAGATSATFPINTLPVSTATPVTITGTQGSTTQTAVLTLTPATLVSLSIAPSTVLGGVASTGTLTLNGLAGPSGSVITVSSTSSSVIVPTTVTVPPASKSMTFPISTRPVSSNTNATITGSLGGVSQSASITVNAPVLVGLTVSPLSVVGGNNSYGTVTLSGPSGPNGATVSLTSTAGASVPATATVPAGASTGTFVVGTSGVPSTIQATIGCSLNGVTETASLTITPANIASLTIAPNPIVGGNTGKGTVSLDGAAPPGGVSVTLNTINSTVTLPASVQIPSGSSSATFSVGTKAITATQTAQINAQFGTGFQSTVLTINPAVLGSVSATPSSVVGGSETTVVGTVTFTGPTLPPGVTIKLSSSDPKVVAIPASVKILSGSATATFTITHKLVKTIDTVTITASFGGVNRTCTLTVTPFQVMSLSMSPPSVAGGVKSTGTVTLNAAPGAGSGSIIVKLSSSQKGITVPASLIIGLGKMAATFTATTTPVSTTTTSTITATYGSGSEQANLTVTPASLLSLTVSPTTVKGSSTTLVNGKVTLTGPAPTGGVIVTLSSSNSGAASGPASVTIRAGATSATFKVTHSKVSTQTTATLTASLAGISKSANLLVTP